MLAALGKSLTLPITWVPFSIEHSLMLAEKTYTSVSNRAEVVESKKSQAYHVLTLQLSHIISWRL